MGNKLWGEIMQFLTSWLRVLPIAFVMAANVCWLSTAFGSITNIQIASSPLGAWNHSETLAPPSYNAFYAPTQADVATATFQNYVFLDPSLKATYGGSGWLGDRPNSGIHPRFEVFSTYVLSDVDQSINLAVYGDDGHSLFFDESLTLIDAKPFGQYAVGTLNLQAGVPRKVTIGGYNYTANWLFMIGEPEDPLPVNSLSFQSTLEDKPGIRISANGDFGDMAIPEPGSVATWLLLGGVVALKCRRQARDL